MVRSNKEKLLLGYLRTDTFTPSSTLAMVLNVSTRQIRKYITSINESYPAPIIIHSNKGYCINPDINIKDIMANETEFAAGTPETRRSYIMQKLICTPNGYNIFDLADELYISVATIESDICKLRTYIRSFNLRLKQEGDVVLLLGNERNKRNLMSSLLTSSGYDYFILKDEVRLLTFHYHLPNFRKTIKDIFSSQGIFINDYSLNNLALHLIITIDRIRNSFELSENVDLHNFKQLKQFRVAELISSYVKDSFDVVLNDSELYNLFLIISNNTSSINPALINEKNINQYIEQYYIDITHEIIHEVEITYHLGAFSEEFITKFTIHIKNMFLRVQKKYFVKNPLTQKVKITYPLIYDIAVFIAQRIKNNYNIFINEDEIAFIAFYIGSYFENTVQNANKITCMFIYADYIGISQNIFDRISNLFSDSLNMKAAISVNEYDPKTMHADLIISTANLSFDNKCVIIDPFLGEKDISNIRSAIERLKTERKLLALKKNLTQLFHSDIFYKNIKFNTRDDFITYLAKDAISKGYAGEEFLPNVLARETMSSTAFHNVAVPHSLGKDVYESFISIVISDEPILWGNKKVYIIAMIGVNDDSREIFAQIFDHLVDIFTESQNIKKLTSSNNFDEFIYIIQSIMSGLE